MDVTNTKHTAAYGFDDDQIIVLVFAALRSKGNDTVCSRSSTKGCSEIFIVESIDEGVTWSKPMFLNRTNKDDIYHRTSPLVAYDRETNTICIACTL
jgi:hypothetical protein